MTEVLIYKYVVACQPDHRYNPSNHSKTRDGPTTGDIGPRTTDDGQQTTDN